MSKNKKIETMAQGQKKMYTIFIVVIMILFVLTSVYTSFNPLVLLQNSDAFIAFITEDFFPPALPKDSKLLGVFSSVLVTSALAMASTTIAAVLAFFVALFGSEKVSPFPKFAKVVRGCYFPKKYSGIGMGIYIILFPWNRYRCWFCGTDDFQFCIYGESVCGDYGRCFSGLCRKPCSSWCNVPGKSFTGDITILH